MKTKICPRVGLSAAILALFATLAAAKSADEYVELTVDEFVEVVVGNTVSGTDGGHAYAEHYTGLGDDQGEISGVHQGRTYKGTWSAGENNCVNLALPGRRTQCWKLLRHKQNGTYAYGVYRKKGMKLSGFHEIEVLEGDQSR